jgi:processive 1,2-diacylglycerol beta-glucosyltransferase
VRLSDIYLECGRFPASSFPAGYALLARRYPLLWALVFHGTNLPIEPTRWLRCLLLPGVRRLLAAERPDLVVSVLPAVNGVLAECARRCEVVLTDWHSVHRFWVAPGVDHYTTPTDSARLDCIRYGAPAESVEVVGLPVGAAFGKPVSAEGRAACLSGLGLDPRRFTVLVMVGAEGSPGALRNVARLARTPLPDAQLVVVCGRNATLQRRVSGLPRSVPLRALGFVDNVAELMRSSDVLVTKAGGLTLAEAFCSGVPVVVHDLVPGQEAGNLAYTLGQHAGEYAPRPAQLASVVQGLQADHGGRARLVENARRLARPHAADDIARGLLERLAETS